MAKCSAPDLFMKEIQKRQKNKNKNLKITAGQEKKHVKHPTCRVKPDYEQVTGSESNSEMKFPEYREIVLYPTAETRKRCLEFKSFLCPSVFIKGEELTV